MGSGGVTGRGGSCWWNLKALGTFRISPLSPSLSIADRLHGGGETSCFVWPWGFFSSSHKMAEVLMLPS